MASQSVGRRGVAVLPAIVAVLALAAVVAAHVFAAIGSTAPIFYTDEVGYIANAQLMAGVGEPRDFSASSYYIGWSVFIVPLWWITQDPQSVYVGVVILSVLCGIAVVVPLTFLAKRLGLALPWSIVAASAIAVAPSRVVMSNFGLAENFIALMVAVTVLAALRFVENPTLGRAMPLMAASAYLFLTHARTSPIVVASVILVVAVFGRRVKSTLVALAVAAVVAIPGFLLYRSLVPLMYQPGVDREERGLHRLLGLDFVSALTATTGQLWYVFAAWFGVALLGLIVVVHRAVTELRSKSFGIGAWGLVAFLGILGVSVVWIAAAIQRGDPRLDIFAYGRYLDSVLGVLALIGVAVAVQWMTRRIAIAWAAASLVVVGLFLLVVYPRVPSADGAWWGPNSVPGIIQWDWPNVSSATQPPWIIASAAALAVVAVTIAIALLGGRPVAVPLITIAAVLVFLVSAVAAEVKTIRPSFSSWYQSFTLRHDVERVMTAHPDASLSFDRAGLSEDLGGVDTVSRNAYQFWLSPAALPVFDSASTAPTTELVIARKDWAEADELGAKLVASDTGMFNNALWVLPGDLQLELEQEGALG